MRRGDRSHPAAQEMAVSAWGIARMDDGRAVAGLAARCRLAGLAWEEVETARGRKENLTVGRWAIGGGDQGQGDATRRPARK